MLESSDSGDVVNKVSSRWRELENGQRINQTPTSAARVCAARTTLNSFAFRVEHSELSRNCFFREQQTINVAKAPSLRHSDEATSCLLVSKESFESFSSIRKHGIS